MSWLDSICASVSSWGSNSPKDDKPLTNEEANEIIEETLGGIVTKSQEVNKKINEIWAENSDSKTK